MSKENKFPVFEGSIEEYLEEMALFTQKKTVLFYLCNTTDRL